MSWPGPCGQPECRPESGLPSVTDPNLVYDLRAKLDASGHYDEFEVDRVVARVALYQNGVSGSPSSSE